MSDDLFKETIVAIDLVTVLKDWLNTKDNEEMMAFLDAQVSKYQTNEDLFRMAVESLTAEEKAALWDADHYLANVTLECMTMAGVFKTMGMFNEAAKVLFENNVMQSKVQVALIRYLTEQR